MRLQIVKSKNAASLYVVKSTYIDGKRSNKIVEKLGTEQSLRKQLNGEDPYEWAKKYVEKLNKKEQSQTREILIKYIPNKTINPNEQRTFNGGYIFLQKIYHELGLHKICKTITSKYKFEFNLDSILSRLLYARIIFPASKHATHQLSTQFIEQPDFELQHIYRGLEVIAKESDYIQSQLYKNSLQISKRNSGVLYYDCTNYFFEIEQEEGLKQYGPSKENRPNPIVQMGLFMDGDGIPLAFSITKGNTNEQQTLKPLEKKILSDFEHSKFVVCTDAGLSSAENRQFNNINGRSFVTTQSIKKLKKHLKEWALDPTGWSFEGSNKTYDISEIDESEFYESQGDNCRDRRFYKVRWIKENGLEQKLIVTYSIKLKKVNPNDYKRLVKKEHCTKDGELAERNLYSIDHELITKEESTDGFYAVCTNLEDNAIDIIEVTKRRWQIEECFRIMKSEFKARPVYLKRDDRILAHFTTCFLSLFIYRLLEKRVNHNLGKDEKFTYHQIIDSLRNLNFHKITAEGYIPTYTRTDFTDRLHETFGFRTDYQIVTDKEMRNILKNTKN